MADPSGTIPDPEVSRIQSWCVFSEMVFSGVVTDWTAQNPHGAPIPAWYYLSIYERSRTKEKGGYNHPLGPQMVRFHCSFWSPAPQLTTPKKSWKCCNVSLGAFCAHFRRNLAPWAPLILQAWLFAVAWTTQSCFWGSLNFWNWILKNMKFRYLENWFSFFFEFGFWKIWNFEFWKIFSNFEISGFEI